MEHARRTCGAALAAALLATLPACRPRPAPAGSVIALAARFPDAEVRSDGLDLAFLVESGAFRWPGWQDPVVSKGSILVWSQLETATLALPLATNAPKLLTFRARCHPSLGPSLPLRLRLGDTPLAEVELRATDQEFQITLPSLSGPVPLVFAVSRRYVPPRKTRDERPAAVGLSFLQVSRVGAIAARSLPALERRTLVLPPASSLGFYVRLGPAGRLSATASGGPGPLEAWLVTEAASTAIGGRAVGPGATPVEWPLAGPPGFARVELRNPGRSALRLDDALLAGADEGAQSPLPPARLATRPSIVVFLTDTLRADRLSTYGFAKPTSPNLDAFAREAIRFDDAWAQSSWTRPTVASLFTGVHPATHRAIGFDRPLAERFVTLAEAFRKAGYRTGAIVSNHVVHHRFGFAQGFDEWNDAVVKLYGITAAEVVERGLKFVDRGKGPFLLYLHTMEPHATYEPSDEAYELFGPAGQERRPSRPLLMQPRIGPGAAGYLDALYQGEVWDNDRAFGTLVDGLRERGLLDSTLLVFTSDHGEEFLDHGGKGHGHSLYRELIRVPFLVRLPEGRLGGSRQSEAIAQVDVLPTLASLCGVEAPAGEGRDLSSLWLGRKTAIGMPELMSETRFGKSEKQALRVGRVKLVVNHDPRRYGEGGGPPELYDLAADPAEKLNLAESRPVAREWLRRRLAALLKLRRQKSEDVERMEITEEDREALRALGYVN
ncbi:MAG TPA: sulfatase [Vicinamibacteria bacterium]|nr:sulfatase [Vicinamibacteria bacterium]